MPNAHEQRQICPAAHTTHTDGRWTRGADEALGAVQCSDGRWIYKLRCRSCGTTGSPVATSALDTWGLKPTDVEWSRQNAPQQYEPCCHQGCPVTPTEYHHFAPRNTFGTEADEWPCLPLCRPHHVEWHQRMDGYRWHRKGIAA